MTIEAMIFDVDGTIADTEEAHRQAFNAAFSSIRLFWNWERAQYGRLLAVSGGKERILAYSTVWREPAEKARLAGIAPLVHAHQDAHLRRAGRDRRRALRPGVARLLREAREAGVRLAIASTTTKTNVERAARCRRCAPTCAAGSTSSPAATSCRRRSPRPTSTSWRSRRCACPPRSASRSRIPPRACAAARGAGIRTVITPTLLDRSRRLPGRRRRAAAPRRSRHAARRGRAKLAGGTFVGLEELAALVGDARRAADTP